MLFPTAIVSSHRRPDCAMKYLPREVADGKLRAMVEGAKILRADHPGS